MTASLLKFPKSVAFPAQQPDVAARSANRAVVLGRTSGRLGKSPNPGNPLQIRSFTLTARHPRHIVVRADNQNRFIISQTPLASRKLTAGMAGEEAAICANLAGLFISPRGIRADLSNLVRALVPGNLIRALLQPLQKSVSRCADRLHFLTLSAGPSGLVARSERTQSKRKGKSMSDTRRVTSDPKQSESVMSVAASEAFGFLNELTQRHYRGWGDTATAARDRAAKEAGISRAQAERLWKRWQHMKTVNGDVYRALRNKYESVCENNNKAAAAYDAQRLQIEARNGTSQEPVSAGAGMAAPEMGAKKGEMR